MATPARKSDYATSRFPRLAKYEVLEEIGHGGMATVYRAHDARLARDVAIKVLHPHLRDSEEVAVRFGAEAKAVAKLRHGNIVEVYDVSGDDDDEQYLVVELVRGETLRALLRREKKLPAEVAAALAVEVAQALAHAHAHGVVHRDVKPENVMVEHQPPPHDAEAAQGHTPGQRCRVKLMDFGIAKLLDTKGVTSTGQVLGSPAHMAPEQIEGNDVDGRADVFAVGVMLYECMSGELPFRGNNPAQVLRRVLEGTFTPVEHLQPDVGKRWSDIIGRALAPQPADRFQTVAALRDALSAELERLGMPAPCMVLESYLDDPEGFVERQRGLLRERLCALGSQALQANDTLLAAADYNRALALDPSDPALLKLVTRLRRGQARGRLLRRLLVPVLGLVGLGCAAFVGTRYWYAHQLPEEPETRAIVTAPSNSVAPPQPSRPPPPQPSQEVRTDTPAIVVRPPPPKPKQRQLVLRTVRPQEGVLVSIDGRPFVAVSSGSRFESNLEGHELRFTCVRDMCERQSLTVAPGDRDAELSVSMSILPAKLTVEGSPLRNYRLPDYGIQFKAGSPVSVPLRNGTERVQVIELETEAVQRPQMRAGQSTRVVFEAP